MPNGTDSMPPLPNADENLGKIPWTVPVKGDGNEMLVAQPYDAVPEVLEACQRGDQNAFRDLFESHKDKVYSIALRYAGSHSAAMDIAQDTFLKLMDRIGQFRGDSSFDSWLYRLVVNSCLDYRRRQKRWMPMLEEFFDSFRAHEPTALQEMVKDEMQQQVQDVVAKLAPEHRMVVVLRYTEGLSYEEIADLLQCSRGTVASRLNRAHKILERRLGHIART
ncbi:MAG: sigma-70 family RNA polymerase sigma factor [Acidobacteriota bacterium]